MIAAVALSLALGLNPVSEWVDPAAKAVSVQAVVRLPYLTPRERAETALLAATMADEVEGYGRADMRDLAGSVGDSLRIAVMPDHLRISISLPPSQMKPGIAYLDQILRSSRLSTDSLNKALADLPYRKSSLWSSAVQPYRLDWAHIRREDVVALYHRLFRPEAVWLAVGGPVEAGQADEYWKEINSNWTVDRWTVSPREPATKIDTVPGSESIVELTCPEISGTDVALPTKLLAVIALGAGKGSALFERIREGHGWSYRQEGMLWPSENGFVPRLIIATGEKTPLADIAAGMKKELVEAAAAWTEDDLNRAKGLAEGILLRGLPVNPLYFNPSWPVTDSLDDQTFLAAYWPMKTGHPWAPRKLLGEIALVGLDDLKETAAAMLQPAIPQIIPASG